MSSGVEAVGELAGVVLAGSALVAGASVAALMGAGWVAWQGGKLLVGAGLAAVDLVEEKKNQKLQQQKQRYDAAVCGHDQLVNACRQVLAELEHSSQLTAGEREELRRELMQICQEAVPEDAQQIELLNLRGYGRMEQVVARNQRLKNIKVEAPGLYTGLSLADLMADMKRAFAAAVLTETTGANVRAADPEVLERAKLNKRLQEAAGRVLSALEYIVDLSQNYGLTQGSNAWFLSCFNGVDQELARLYQPTTSNEALKKGIRRLEDQLTQYDMLRPSIEKTRQQLALLYPVYAQAAQALGERVKKLKSFASLQELEAEMEELKVRAERAQECAEIRSKLGTMGYICYAWDEELRQMGYSVKSRKRIMEMAGTRPQRAKLGEQDSPFYEWTDGEMTQMYSISPECSLQLIVHEDGTVSMQTVADHGEDIRALQAHHCSQMKTLHERLRKNWFILYDHKETIDADQVLTAHQWSLNEDNAWTAGVRQGELVLDQRQQEQKANDKTMKQ